jgi:alpha-tubulin suppressor-like RCC1 family protein
MQSPSWFSSARPALPACACPGPRRLVPLLGLVMLVASLGCRDDVQSPTAPSRGPELGAAATVALSFRQVAAGGFHTCGVTLGNEVYCWGNNGVGQLGLTTIGADVLRPALVVGGLRFRQISGGSEHTCGVTTDSLAYCWGRNTNGQLGNGTTTDRSTPTPVSGGRKFRQVDAGYSHTCGVTSAKRAYCWGKNDFGQLGDGTTSDRLRPVAVAGARQFRQVAAGGDNYLSHTCGVTSDDLVFCWGSNGYGQVGDSTVIGQRLSPTQVAGARRYRQVDTGGIHSCAVTISERVFCWGYGTAYGKSYLKRFWPTVITGGLSFSRVALGNHHTCGETTGNKAYCWGIGEFGQLGDGEFNSIRSQPTAVLGGLSFSQLSAGYVHTCGRTPENVAYCWGNNFNAALGDGTEVHRTTPTAVLGPI